MPFLLDVVLFLAFNPFEWPFTNLLSLFPQLKQFGWYTPVFWSLIGVIFIIAVIVAARAKRKTAEHAELKLGAIKGLLPFGYEDAEVFSHLQRDQNLKECLQAIGDEQWRFGVLSGESGAGKTSLTSHYGVGGPGKARALARILMACSHPELIGK